MLKDYLSSLPMLRYHKIHAALVSSSYSMTGVFRNIAASWCPARLHDQVYYLLKNQDTIRI